MRTHLEVVRIARLRLHLLEGTDGADVSGTEGHGFTIPNTVGLAHVNALTVFHMYSEISDLSLFFVYVCSDLSFKATPAI